MKNKILELVKTHPRHYHKLIKKDKDLLNWVYANSLIRSEKLPELIYSAVYQESNICKNGKIKKFTRFGTGFSGCGPASECMCTKENISKGVSTTKQTFSKEKHIQINDKREKTMLSKYGASYNSQRDEIKNILSKPKIPINTHEKLIDKDWLNQEYNINKKSLTEIADDLGVYYSTVGEYCKKFGFIIRPTSLRSKEEIQICNFLKNFEITIEESNRTVISPKELDIYIPEKQFAIEINGLFWHSYHPSVGLKENRLRHIEKTQLSLQAGVQLMHITDYEWNNKQQVIESLIKSKLGINTKISARNCSIQIIDQKIEKDFFNNYHLQGYIPSSIAIGLTHNNELVMLLSLGKSRFKKNYDYEVLRLCSKSGITVVGGLSKIISFIKRNYSNKIIVSYCDLSKGTGVGYKKAGFEFIGNTGPGYYWTNGTIIISRYKCQKNKLSSWLTSFDISQSETVNMFNAGYRRYWDCGNSVYRLWTEN